jgi:ABC-2 type transport system ATP-binding protein
MELVLDHRATEVPASPFGRSTVTVGNRLMVAVPIDAAGAAVSWAEMLERAGTVEEFTLGPATLEDVYVAMVGNADASPADLEESLDASAA